MGKKATRLKRAMGLEGAVRPVFQFAHVVRAIQGFMAATSMFQFTHAVSCDKEWAEIKSQPTWFGSMPG
jgi:hypothetical protein